MKKLLILLLIVTGFCASAQKLEGQARIDSLQKELQNAKEDTDVVDINVHIAKVYYKIDKDSSKHYATKAKQLAGKIAYPHGIEQSAFRIGQIAYDNNDYKTALHLFKELLDSKLSIIDSAGIAFAYYKLSFSYLHLHIYDSMVYCMDRSTQYNPNKIEAAGTLGMAASTIRAKGGPSSVSYTCFKKQAEIYKKLGMVYKEADAYADLTMLFGTIGNDSSARIYANKALDILLKKPDSIRANYFALIKLIDFEKRIKAYGKAHELANWMIAEERRIGDIYGVVYGLNQNGSIYYEEGKYKEALKEHREAYGISQKVNNDFLIYASTASMAECYNMLGNYTQALKYAKYSMKKRGPDSDFWNLEEDYQLFVELYKNIGNYKKAFEYQGALYKLQDSLAKDENKAEIARMETQARVTADSLQNIKVQEEAAQKLIRQRRYTFAGVGGVLLLIVVAFFIAKERKKSDKLLLNILPTEVAKELKAKGASDARLFDNVTVLFTDFVGFTTVSERLTPQELVHELDECFKAFDEILDKYNIEKIKTIGDAYLAVCGLPTADERHAEKVVQAAQEIRTFMVDRHAKLGDKTFEVRVGVHSGDVVAGIVGVKKFAYDIWGDTVNTAARMEQNSEAGKINISQTTYELVQDKFTCTYRGELEAKNKGKLKMYFVEV